MKLLHVPTLRLATNLRRGCIAALLAAALLPGASALASEEHTPCSDAVPLAAAVFAPRRVEDGIAWDARFIVTVDTSFAFTGGQIAFATPLPAGERLVPEPVLTPLFDGERVRGLCVGPGALHDRTIAATFVQPLKVAADATTALGAPIAESAGVQIVETALGDAQLELTGNPALEKHVGYVAPHAVSDAAREEARRLTSVQPRMNHALAYVRAEDAHRGLEARIVEPPARRRASAAGIIVLFGALVGALVLAARRLRERATVERADALLASEIEDAAGE